MYKFATKVLTQFFCLFLIFVLSVPFPVLAGGDGEGGASGDVSSSPGTGGLGDYGTGAGPGGDGSGNGYGGENDPSASGGWGGGGNDAEAGFGSGGNSGSSGNSSGGNSTAGYGHSEGTDSNATGPGSGGGGNGTGAGDDSGNGYGGGNDPGISEFSAGGTNSSANPSRSVGVSSDIGNAISSISAGKGTDDYGIGDFGEYGAPTGPSGTGRDGYAGPSGSTSGGTDDYGIGNFGEYGAPTGPSGTGRDGYTGPGGTDDYGIGDFGEYGAPTGPSSDTNTGTDDYGIGDFGEFGENTSRTNAEAAEFTLSPARSIEESLSLNPANTTENFLSVLGRNTQEIDISEALFNSTLDNINQSIEKAVASIETNNAIISITGVAAAELSSRVAASLSTETNNTLASKVAADLSSLAPTKVATISITEENKNVVLGLNNTLAVAEDNVAKAEAAAAQAKAAAENTNVDSVAAKAAQDAQEALSRANLAFDVAENAVANQNADLAGKAAAEVASFTTAAENASKEAVAASGKVSTENVGLTRGITVGNTLSIGKAGSMYGVPETVVTLATIPASQIKSVAESIASQKAAYAAAEVEFTSALSRGVDDQPTVEQAQALDNSRNEIQTAVDISTLSVAPPPGPQGVFTNAGTLSFEPLSTLNVRDLTPAQADKLGLNKDNWSTLDVKTLAILLAGELRSDIVRSIIAGNENEGIISAAGLISDSVSNRTDANIGYIALGAYESPTEAMRAAAQYSAFNEAYIDDTMANYNKNPEAFDALALSMVDGTATSKYGLDVTSPTPTIDSYANPNVSYVSPSFFSGMTDISESIGSHVGGDRSGEYGRAGPSSASIASLSNSFSTLTSVDSIGIGNNSNTDNISVASLGSNITSPTISAISGTAGQNTNSSRTVAAPTVSYDPNMSLAAAESQIASQKAGYNAAEAEFTSALSRSEEAQPTVDQAKSLDNVRAQIATIDHVVTESRNAAANAQATYNQAETEFTSSLSRTAEAQPTNKQAEALDIARASAELSLQQAEKATIAAAQGAITEAVAAKAASREEAYVATALANASLPGAIGVDPNNAVPGSGYVSKDGKVVSIADLDISENTKAKLSIIAAKLDFLLTVTSETRTATENEIAKGALNSQHLSIHATAVDISMKSLTAEQQAQAKNAILSTVGVNGYGRYVNTVTNAVHFDTRSTRTGLGYWSTDIDGNGIRSSVDFDAAVSKGMISAEEAAEVAEWSKNGVVSYTGTKSTMPTAESVRSTFALSPEESAAIAALSVDVNSPQAATARSNAAEAASKMAEAASIANSATKSVSADGEEESYDPATESRISELTAAARSLAESNKQIAAQAQQNDKGTDNITVASTGNSIRSGVKAVANAITSPISTLGKAWGAITGIFSSNSDDVTPNNPTGNGDEGFFYEKNAAARYFKDNVGETTDDYVPVYLQLEETTGEIKVRRDFSEYTRQNEVDSYGLRGISNAPIVFGDEGQVIYSDGTYAPVTIDGQQIDTETDYVYFIERTINGVPQTLDENASALPGNAFTNLISGWFDNDNPFFLEDVDRVGVKRVDPNTQTFGDEYRVYSIILNDNTERSIAVPSQTSLSFIDERFKASGYKGDTLALLAKAEEHVDEIALTEATDSFLTRIKNLITSPFGSNSAPDDEHASPFSFGNLSTNTVRSSDLIEKIDVYFNLPFVSCPDAPGVNKGYLYNVTLSNGDTVGHVRCGTGNAYTYATQIALHMYNYEGFKDIQPDDVLNLVNFKFYYPGSNSGADTVVERNFDNVQSQPVVTLPVNSNLISFEIKVSNSNGNTKYNWSSGDVTISSSDIIAFRWDAAAEYDQCLLYLADNGRYSLSRTKDFTMVTGNTETESFDVIERSGPYRIQCNQDTENETGIDEKIINVTVQ